MTKTILIILVVILILYLISLCSFIEKLTNTKSTLNTNYISYYNGFQLALLRRYIFINFNTSSSGYVSDTIANIIKNAQPIVQQIITTPIALYISDPKNTPPTMSIIAKLLLQVIDDAIYNSDFYIDIIKMSDIILPDKLLDKIKIYKITSDDIKSLLSISVSNYKQLLDYQKDPKKNNILIKKIDNGTLIPLQEKFSSILSNNEGLQLIILQNKLQYINTQISSNLELKTDINLYYNLFTVNYTKFVQQIITTIITNRKSKSNIKDINNEIISQIAKIIALLPPNLNICIQNYYTQLSINSIHFIILMVNLIDDNKNKSSEKLLSVINIYGYYDRFINNYSLFVKSHIIPIINDFIALKKNKSNISDLNTYIIQQTNILLDLLPINYNIKLFIDSIIFKNLQTQLQTNIIPDILLKNIDTKTYYNSLISNLSSFGQSIIRSIISNYMFSNKDNTVVNLNIYIKKQIDMLLGLIPLTYNTQLFVENQNLKNLQTNLQNDTNLNKLLKDIDTKTYYNAFINNLSSFGQIIINSIISNYMFNNKKDNIIYDLNTYIIQQINMLLIPINYDIQLLGERVLLLKLQTNLQNNITSKSILIDTNIITYYSSFINNLSPFGKIIINSMINNYMFNNNIVIALDLNTYLIQQISILLAPK